MTNEKWALSFIRPHFTCMQKCGLFSCQKHHQTMSYSVPLWAQWEVPGPTSPHTISLRACPTPTIVPHSTHTYTQWPLQSQGSHHAIPSHKDTHQSLSHQKGKNDRGGRRKKLYPLGRDRGKWVKHKGCKCVWGGCGCIREGHIYCKVRQLLWCVRLLVSRVLSLVTRAFEVHMHENIKLEKLCHLWNTLIQT